VAFKGTIFALDLGVHTGFAFGEVGALPASGTVVLKKPTEHRSVAFGNLMAWLDDEFRRAKPALVVKEAPLPLQAYKTLGNAAFTVRVTHAMHGIVEGVCERFAIPFEEIADATVRKHFVGRANYGNRAATKAAVVQRCHLLGYMPRESRDDNRADALATWDWAAATFGNRRTESLHLFGEGGRCPAPMKATPAQSSETTSSARSFLGSLPSGESEPAVTQAWDRAGTDHPPSPPTLSPGGDRPHPESATRTATPPGEADKLRSSPNRVDGDDRPRPEHPINSQVADTPGGADDLEIPPFMRREPGAPSSTSQP